MKEDVSGVQRLVEAPYVYIIGRSGSAVKDQLVYVPTRLEDIADLSEPLMDENGVQFHDKLRFFSGKYPFSFNKAKGQLCAVFNTSVILTYGTVIHVHVFCIAFSNMTIYKLMQFSIYGIKFAKMQRSKPNLIQQIFQ